MDKYITSFDLKPYYTSDSKRYNIIHNTSTKTGVRSRVKQKTVAGRTRWGPCDMIRHIKFLHLEDAIAYYKRKKNQNTASRRVLKVLKELRDVEVLYS